VITYCAFHEWKTPMEGPFSIVRKKMKNWLNALKRENKIRGINITIILIIWKCQKINVFPT